MEKLEPVISVYAESCVPSLRGGEYELRIRQNTNLFGQSLEHKRNIVVEGPRFSLSPGDVLSVYPPAGMRGSFGSCLPHAVFTRRTLPWERSTETQKMTDGASPAKTLPWLAMLLLSNNEIPVVRSGTVKQILSHDDNTYFPVLNITEDEKKESALFVDIEAKVFRALVPAEEDMPYLCHARKADASLKADSLLPEDGWLSVVAGNRVPERSGAGVPHRALIVSLEGFGDYLKNPGKQGLVRLVTLYWWDFVSITSQYDFMEILTGIEAAPLCPPAVTGDKTLDGILANGFIPVVHELRNGDRTTSFYRGPLTPGPVGRADSGAEDADSLYRYDPGLGVFDISLAAAWQQGRMIALGNRSVAMEIMRRRTENHLRAHCEAVRGMMARQIDGYDGDDTLGAALLRRMEECL